MWSGVEYKDSYGYGMYYDGADWNVPSVSSGGADCSNYENSTCLVSMWVGESTYGEQTGAYLDQTGTDSYCYGSCSSHYYVMWYQFWEDLYPTQYYNLCDYIGSGNTIEAYVTESTYDSEYYEASIYDATTLQGCTGYEPSNFAMGEAYYAKFEAECPWSRVKRGLHFVWDPRFQPD